VPTDRDDDSGRFREQYLKALFVEAVGNLDMSTTQRSPTALAARTTSPVGG